jgi:hypothetical protein
MIPNFILGGAMKSGTTFLHSLLNNHDQIRIIDRNMDHAYFDDDRIYFRGKDWYLSLFDGVIQDMDQGKIIGQTSADCNFNPGSVKRILDHNPNIKLIFVLRHPIERTYSLYWHQYGMGREFRNFEKAIKIEKQVITQSYYNFKNYSYLERSRYNKQFEEIIKLMPVENLLILDFESLVKDTLSTMNIVLKFLGVNQIASIEQLNLDNIGRNPARIPTNHAIVLLSSGLQKLGFLRLGRKIINMFRKEMKPPKMKEETFKRLEMELKNDIEFFFKVKNDFRKMIIENKLNYES